MDAYGRIVRRFQDMAYGYAYSLLGDFHLAEDAAQEAFVRAYRDLAALNEPAAFPGWFRRIVFKYCDRLQRGRRVSTAPLDRAGQVSSPGQEPSQAAEQREMADNVLEAIRALPDDQRTATTLFYINGYSQRDIAEFLEVPVTTVNSRLATSRKRLKQRMLTMVADELKSHPLPDDFISRVLRRYRFDRARVVGVPSRGPHRHQVYRVAAEDRPYALKVHHEYMDEETMSAIARVRAHLRASGVATPDATSARDESRFIEVDGRFCAVYEWADGEASAHDSLDALSAVAGIQGQWIAAMSTFDDPDAVEILSRPRQRKDWAWIVPLDRLQEAVTQLDPLGQVRAFKTSASYHQEYLRLLPEIESRLAVYRTLLEDWALSEPLHGVTHGDLWAGNVLLTVEGAIVVDLDLCSYEPPLADFARVAAWRRDMLGADGAAKMFSHLRASVSIHDGEIDTVPVLMAAHCLYYQIFHCMLYVREDEGQAGYLVEGLPSELQAFDEVVSGEADIAAALRSA